MADKARLIVGTEAYDLPLVVGTENERAVDIAQLRAESGLITLDEGYGNTGSCQSKITFIDGERGILRYRGYPIEQLAEHSTFLETAYLIIFGELPNEQQFREFRELISEHMFIHEAMRHHFEGFPPNAPPMAILSAMINTLGCFEPQITRPQDNEDFTAAAARLISKVRTIAAASYKKAIGDPIIYPRFDLSYTGNFLHMMFCRPNKLCDPDPAIERALDQIFILHADHEQNCSMSTVAWWPLRRPTCTRQSRPACALWGPLHGGANVAVINMLEAIRQSGESVESFVTKVKDKRAHATDGLWTSRLQELRPARPSS